MFDKLSSLFTDEIKEKVTSQLLGNDSVDNKDISDDAVKTGTDSIFESLKDELLDGKLDDIMGVLKNRSGDLFDNPIIKSLISKATGKLSAAKGLDTVTSENIVKSTLPAVMEKMEEKDGDDSAFSIDSMMGMLKGDSKEDDLMSNLSSSLTRGIGGLFG